jgi:hypothetical protein
MITQSDYAVVSKEDNKIKRFCMVKEGDDVPTEEGFIYVKVSQEVREFIYEDEFDPDAELGSIYFKGINKFAPNIEGIDYEEFYVFNTISKVWIPPQMSNDKVTHIWSNFEQNFIPI